MILLVDGVPVGVIDGILLVDGVPVGVGVLEGVGVGLPVGVGNAAGGSEAPGGSRTSDTSSHAMLRWIQVLTKNDIAAGSQASMKSACSVIGLFIDANVTVPRVESTGKRSAKVSCGSRTG